MDNTTPTAQPFKTLQILHLAMCMAVILFLATTLIKNNGKGHTDIRPHDTVMLCVAIAFAIVLPLLSQMMYQKKLAEIDMAAPLNTRIAQFTTACLIRYAVLEAAGLFNVVVWYVTGNLILAITGGAIIVLMIALRPVKNKVINTLQISYPDTLD